MSTKTETALLSIITIMAFIFTAGAYFSNYLNLFQSAILMAIAGYTVVLLYIVLKLNHIDKITRVNAKFVALGDELMRYSLEQYLDFQRHGDLRRFIDSIMLKSTHLHHKKISSLLLKDIEDYDLSPDRLHELLDKYRKGTLTEKEAWELKELLEKEKEKKEKKGQDAEALLLGLIIIGVLLWLASRKD